MTCEHCPKPIYCKGLCRAHYVKLRRYNDPLGGKFSHGLTEWIADLVQQPPTTNCIDWPFSTYSNGYPQYRNRRGTHAVLEMAGRPRPAATSMVLHSCDRRICVNPQHLRWGTHADNMNDRDKRGRTRNQWTGPLPDTMHP